MSTALQLRRGTTAQTAAFTGLAGEVTVDTDKDTLVVHDGTTAGGFPAARAGANTDITSLGAVASLNGGQLAGMRNKIINGNFGINQRAVSGTVVLAAGAYGHDRWKAGAGGCTYTFSTSLNVTTITISAGTLQQVIEGLNLESGTFKLSWSGTATGRVDAGSYGASGVVGTAVGGTNQTIEFATGTVSKVQYEFGSVATPFEHRPYGAELALCQRYYSIVSEFNAQAGATTSVQLSIRIPEMRATPTVSASAGLVIADGVATFTQSSFSFTNQASSIRGVNGYLSNFTGLTVRGMYQQGISGGPLLLSSEL